MEILLSSYCSNWLNFFIDFSLNSLNLFLLSRKEFSSCLSSLALDSTSVSFCLKRCSIFSSICLKKDLSLELSRLFFLKELREEALERLSFSWFS